MPKFSRTGKPLCCRCRKLASSRQAGHRNADGVVETFYVYHCSGHALEHDEPLPLQAQPEPEPKMYKSWEEAQLALDRGETVRIEMDASEINPGLVQLAQDLQDREQLARWEQAQATPAYQVGDRVWIRIPLADGKLRHGTVYSICRDRKWPYHVMPERDDDEQRGVAYAAHELAPGDLPVEQVIPDEIPEEEWYSLAAVFGLVRKTDDDEQDEQPEEDFIEIPGAPWVTASDVAAWKDSNLSEVKCLGCGVSFCIVDGHYRDAAYSYCNDCFQIGRTK